MVSGTSALTLSAYRYTERPQEYAALYEEVFAQPPGPYVPSEVLVGQNATGECVGFLGVYLVDAGTAMIQAAGLTHQTRHAGGSLRWVSQALDYLHQRVWHVMAEVPQTNLPALRLALKAGFLIMGTRLAPDGSLLVLIRHTKESSHG